MPSPWPRRLVALFLHAPGLWLVHGEPLPRKLWRPNLIAAAVTACFMAATFWLAPDPWGWPRGVIAVWLAGHLAWGAYLASALSRSHRDADADDVLARSALK